jgi:hypothetical protein
LPPASRCFHSISKMKFSYWRSERSTPTGLPLHMSRPSLAVQVFGPVFTLTQPLSVSPSNKGRNAGGSPENAVPASSAATIIMLVFIIVSFVPCLHAVLARADDADGVEAEAGARKCFV